MKKQFQHIIPQMYFREFGYVHNSQDFISVLDRELFPNMDKVGNIWISQKSIESFLIEDKIYDLPLTEDSNVIELQNGLIETTYSQLLKNLSKNNYLTRNDEGDLIQIVANFYCRNFPFRKFVEDVIQSGAKDIFLDEITSANSQDEKIDFLYNLKLLNYSTNLIIASTWFYLIHEFRGFEYVLFKSNSWMTSDNPVVIMNNIAGGTILSDKTEVLFPISKEYCVYFYFPDNKSRIEQFKRFKHREIVQTEQGSDLYTFISDNIFINSIRYLIFPEKINKKIGL